MWTEAQCQGPEACRDPGACTGVGYEGCGEGGEGRDLNGMQVSPSLPEICESLESLQLSKGAEG